MGFAFIGMKNARGTSEYALGVLLVLAAIKKIVNRTEKDLLSYTIRTQLAASCLTRLSI